MERFSDITTTGAPDKRKIERKKTKGEEMFDWSVYGGIGWVANAIISVFITDQLYNNKKEVIPTKEGKISLKQWFQNGESWLKEQKWNLPERWLPKKFQFTKNAVFGGSLCIGGSLVVPVIKWFEDRKGSIVRKWDEKFYGDKVNTDPDIVQAHLDMDHAPHQSWASLLGARLTVVGIAFGMGPTIGGFNSMSGKAFGNVPILKHFSSFEGFGASVARTLGNVGNWFSKEKPLMNTAVAKASPLKIITDGPLEEHRALKVAEITGYELTQSATIAALFYTISKAFAAGEKKPENPRPRVTVLHAPTVKAEAAPVDAKPHTKVSEVATKQRVEEPDADIKRAAAI